MNENTYHYNVRISPLTRRVMGWALLAERLPGANWSAQAAYELGCLLLSEGDNDRAFERWLNAGVR